METEQQDGAGEDFKEDVRAAVLNDSVFISATFSSPRNRNVCPWTKVSARPVRIKGRPMVQFTFSKGSREVHRNERGRSARECLEEVLALPFGQVHVQTVTDNLHVKITRKGRAMVSHGKPLSGRPRVAHDRTKGHPLNGTGAEAFLTAVGIMDQRGDIVPSMQAKFRQIGEFLKLVALVSDEDRRDEPLRILDCGCGRAYLTLAAYHYFTSAMGRATRVTGIDQESERITECQGLVESLSWPDVTFQVSRILDFAPVEPPDLVLSLHACDTATDEAIAKAVQCGSRAVLAAPCCQHELHKQLAVDPFRAVTRNGILRERMADIVTDALRAAALRVMGYRTNVIEFISPEHTSKNLIIRAERTGKPGRSEAVAEYLALRDFWSVTPQIEVLLGEPFARCLDGGGEATP